MTNKVGRPPTILLIDDNAGLLANIRFALAIRGYRVLTATNAFDGLQLVVDEEPDCVVLDVVMDQMNGHQLARALRGDPETAATPIVMLSALQQQKQIFAGEAAGADYYLTKPASIPLLLETVYRAIALSQQQREEHINTLAEQSKRETRGEEWRAWSRVNDAHDRLEREQDSYDQEFRRPW